MLFHLASWILLSGCAAAIGAGVLRCFKSSAFGHVGDHAIAAVWLGLITIGCLLLALSLISPLKPGLSFGLVAALAVVALSRRTVRADLSRWLSYLTAATVIGIAVLFMAVAFNSTRMVQAFDTGLYHYQFVRWLSDFGTVRGIAIFQERFGWSSSWFALAAPFDFGPFQGRVSGLTGGLAIFLALLHLALAVGRALYHRASQADWVLIGGYALIISICLAWAFEVSLSPDVPIWILTLLAGWLIMVAADRETGTASTVASGNAAILPLLFALAAFTVKLSAAPVVVVAGIFYWLNSKATWTARLGLAAGMAPICLPLLAANVKTSACLLYPNSLLCLDVPWGVGKAAANESAAGIKDWARWGGPTPADATSWNWILPWFSHLDRLLLIALCVLCLLGLAATRGWRANRSFRYVLALALLGTAFVLVTAPNPRFGAGFLALYPALFLASIAQDSRILQNWGSSVRLTLKPSTTLTLLLIAMAVLVTAQGSYREMRLRRSVDARLSSVRVPSDHNFLNRLLVPPKLPSTSGDLIFISNRRFDLPSTMQLTVESYNGIEYRRPRVGDQCWGATIPCLPHPLEGDVHLRDPQAGLSGGFTRSADSR